MVNGYDLIVVLGPTACGKTRFAVCLAHALGGEVISADSRQVYRQMDIGTGKDLAEYHLGDDVIPYHLIDIVDSGYRYNVYEYQRDFLNAYNKIKGNNHVPILCGGTGMYIESVLRGYKLLPVRENPELRKRLSGCSLEELTGILKSYKTLHNSTDVDTAKRAIRAIEIEEYYKAHPSSERSFPLLKALVIGLDISRQSRRERITARLEQRLTNGLVEEVRHLLGEGLTPEDLIYYGLEYKYVTLYVIGRMGYEEMRVKLETAIHQFAKRQMTWFRGMERRGIDIHWIDVNLPMEEKITMAHNLLVANPVLTQAAARD